jgi:tRNA-(ms[2]io[6]A)-hydroxylase
VVPSHKSDISDFAVDLEPTQPGWLAAVLGDFEHFLQDHASCEKKASGMALNIASHYPDRPQLLNAMADLAVEELTHYREVVRLLTERGLRPAADSRDAYARSMNSLIRQGPEHFLLDRLLIAAIVERRGFERFGLIAAALPAGAEQRFYTAITASEDRHWQLFLELATSHCSESLRVSIPHRLAELIVAEGEIVKGLPLRSALH